MLKNILTVGSLAVLLCVGLAGVAVAGEGNRTDILGTDEFVFSTMETDSDRIAKAHVYDQDALSRVGTEAGNWKYESMSSEQKASEGVAGQADKMDTKCSNC
jgi:hypothetical protein